MGSILRVNHSPLETSNLLGSRSVNIKGFISFLNQPSLEEMYFKFAVNVLLLPGALSKRYQTLVLLADFLTLLTHLCNLLVFELGLPGIALTGKYLAAI